jgi:hypothetical protein
MAIVSISIVPVTNAWGEVSAAYRALTAAIRKKPQPNTVDWKCIKNQKMRIGGD